jgi:hypothetical protein
MSRSKKMNLRIPKEATMHYKTIVLELLEQHPEIHERLRSKRQLLLTMERYAVELKFLHDDWKADLGRAKPHSDEIQIENEALHLALEDLQTALRQEFSANGQEALSLDRAMAFVRSHMPTA